MNAVVSDSTLPTVLPPAAAAQLPTTTGDAAFSLAQRKAKAYASSTLVPKAYQQNIPNVLIAMEIAQRIGANELMVMQNLHIVQGRPSWSSSFLIATVNACGRFTPMRFEVRGTDPSKPDYAVRAIAKDKESGSDCVGAWITWPMVKAEGWESKTGSKWKTMPEQMFLYRAAGFWSRVYAPEVSMGILTREEVEDVWGGAPQPNAPTVHDAGSLKALEADLTGNTAHLNGDMPVSADEIRERMNDATNVDELNEAYDLVREITDPDERESLTQLYDTRAIDLQ